jgi:hypothetical protein
MYLNDPKTKEPSPTLTMMFIGVSVALVKLLLSEATVFGIKLSAFSGTDFAMVVGPFLALYGHKRQVFSGAKGNAEQTDDADQSK